MESALPRNLAARLSEECGQRRGSLFVSTAGASLSTSIRSRL